METTKDTKGPEWYASSWRACLALHLVRWTERMATTAKNAKGTPHKHMECQAWGWALVRSLRTTGIAHRSQVEVPTRRMGVVLATDDQVMIRIRRRGTAHRRACSSERPLRESEHGGQARAAANDSNPPPLAIPSRRRRRGKMGYGKTPRDCTAPATRSTASM